MPRCFWLLGSCQQFTVGEWNRGPWNILENLGGIQKKFESWWVPRTLILPQICMSILWHNHAIGVGHNNFLHAWRWATKIFHMFEGGGHEHIYHYGTFQATFPAVIIRLSSIKTESRSLLQRERALCVKTVKKICRPTCSFVLLVDRDIL